MYHLIIDCLNLRIFLRFYSKVNCNLDTNVLTLLMRQNKFILTISKSIFQLLDAKINNGVILIAYLMSSLSYSVLSVIGKFYQLINKVVAKSNLFKSLRRYAT